MPLFRSSRRHRGLISRTLGAPISHPAPGGGKKTAEGRLRATLDAVEALADKETADRLAAALPADGNARAQTSRAISLGFSGSSRDDDVKARRHAIRGILLVAAQQGKTTSELRTMRRDLERKHDAALLHELHKALGYHGDQLAGDFSKRTEWHPDNFTKPEEHDAGRFQYIVTAIKGISTPIADLNLGDIGTSKEQDYENTVQEFRDRFDALDPTIVDEQTRDWGEGRLTKKLRVNFYKAAFRNPDFVKDNLNSTSVIDEKHRATFTPYGFILSASEGDIGSAATKDQGLSNRPDNVRDELQRVLAANTDYTLLSPTDVLAGTSGTSGGHGYNEIVVVGSDNVAVTAVFVKVDRSGNIYRNGDDNDLTEEIAALILDTGLPIVAIIDDSGKGSDTAATDVFPAIIGLI
ncbi:MAG: hypothetical protein HOW73_25790 [Polyangiaceae bacterium]|nr:hypothetical protein [Polyangiaceae bacterium]